MQHGPGAPAPDDLDMEQRLRRWLAGSTHDVTTLVALQDVVAGERAFGNGAGRDREPQRLASDDGAEVSARAECPAARVKTPPDFGKLSAGALERAALHQSPNVTPSALAVSSRSISIGTVFVFPTTSSSRRATMSGGSKATIVPNCPRLMSPTALPPNLVARTRSKLVGAPPRCRCPSTTDRVSLFVSLASARQTCAPMPPRRSAKPSRAASISDSDPPFGYAPSATTTMLNCAPHRSRARRRSPTIAMSKGISGMRIASAPPATPAYSAIHPA